MLTVLRCLVVLGNLVALAHTYTTFQSSCTAPSASVNFVSSNGTRGTMDILWSCLFTIVACTWTVQHLNVPEQREDKDKGWVGDIKWAIKRAFRSTKWMLATAFVPEVLILKSMGDLFAINTDFERLSQLATEDEVPWSRTHSLLANMGGFVIRCNVPERVGQLKEAKVDPTFSTQAGSPDAVSNAQELDDTFWSRSGDSRSQLIYKERHSTSFDTQRTSPSSGYSNPYHLLASDLVVLKEAGVLHRLPFITKDELNDKNKSDSLVRFLAITQIAWMIIQIIVRAPRHLAVSQLEIAVIALSTCAILIYGLNWEKPKGVLTPYTVLQYRGAIPEAVLEMVGRERQKDILSGSLLTLFFDAAMYILTFGHYYPHLIPGSPVPNHFTPDSHSKNFTRNDWLQLAGLLLSGTIFGAVHAAAWDFAFPTFLERNLWRAASVVCTVAPLFTSLIVLLVDRLPDGENYVTRYNRLGFVLLIFLVLVWALYLAARLFLLVEIFRTLFFLPPSAYVATWAANLPHVA